MDTPANVPLGAVEEDMLRALADAGYLPMNVYVAEMARRRAEMPDDAGAERDGQIEADDAGAP